jgi:hypothetical protein
VVTVTVTTVVQPIVPAGYREPSPAVDPKWAEGKILYRYGGYGVILEHDRGRVTWLGQTYVCVHPQRRTSYTFTEGVDVVCINPKTGQIIRRVRPQKYAEHYTNGDGIAVSSFKVTAKFPKAFKIDIAARRGWEQWQAAQAAQEDKLQ